MSSLRRIRVESSVEDALSREMLAAVAPDCRAGDAANCGSPIVFIITLS